MRVLRMIGTAIITTAMLTSAATAQGQSAEARRLTILTFSAPVQVPGRTLPAGKYRFEIANPETSLRAVRILSEDGMRVITTVMATPDNRTEPPSKDNTVVMFSERAAGSPQAVRTWFYP